ncbi:MAG TPA: glucuronate isomerase [Elusimicrobia bacterium]|nr:glucuronate isomerase [Elusimicrobiota bacterium]
MAKKDLISSKDRFFDSEPTTKWIAQELYDSVKDVPIVSPHGHINPHLFAEENSTFGNPSELIIIPDHYLYRMLYSQGIPMEAVGVPRIDGGETEKDPRKIWKIFADNFYLFRGTLTGIWLEYEFTNLFGIKRKLNSETAMEIYDIIDKKLNSPEYSPRKMFESFNIEVLCTTDSATDTLEYHKKIRDSGWKGKILPTFRPDAIVNLDSVGWKKNIEKLSEVSCIDVHDYKTFIKSLENRRQFFKSMGATCTDSAALISYTAELSEVEANNILSRAFKGEATDEDAKKFTAHMLMEMARMSIEDGMVMQLHCGSYRNHNPIIYKKFGPDKGCDIPIQDEFTRNLKPLLNKYGNDTRLTLILFTLDETNYAREMAPLAGHYPAVKLGPPWWFHDSINGMIRYRFNMMETAGLYNTAGFNDDARSFPSIPARHDLSRRMDASWIAGLVARKIVDMDDAQEMINDTTFRLAKKTYKL